MQQIIYGIIDTKLKRITKINLLFICIKKQFITTFLDQIPFSKQKNTIHTNTTNQHFKCDKKTKTVQIENVIFNLHTFKVFN